MKIKGSAIISSIDYIKIHFGEEGKKEVFARLPEEEQKIVNQPVLSSMWYPLSIFINLNQFTDSIFGKGDLELVRIMGAFGAEHDLKTIYKIFYKIGSIQFILKRASQVFSTYYNQGQMQVLESSSDWGIIELSDFPDITEVYLQRVSGWMEKTIELSGGQYPKVVTIRKLKDGKSVVEFKATWT
ncbi:hypothetical protein KAU33_12955 [Candidatus Dependentiae bacterium]|nr:hypothetical protein [Candidatus Dependentiae bacterium]